MASPITIGLKRISDILRGFYVRNSSGTELAVFDTDGYLYQNGTKLTSTSAELNAIKVQTVCTRYTVAQVNAGQILINPTATGKWKVIDVKMRAIGGAVGAATSVDIKEETSGNVVFSATAAALTQNTLLLVNSANVTATYLGVESTAGKDLLLGKTGSDVTTATHIDVIVTYINSVA